MLSTLAIPLALVACKAPVDLPTFERLTANPAPDFSLEDVNGTSPTFAQQVSPRDHLDRISAWYFGHST